MMEEYYGVHQNLPFVKAVSVEELAKEILSEKNYEDDSFFKIYCKENKAGMTENVLRRTLLGENVSELTETKLPDNGKQNVIIYPGPLFKNGITSSVLSLRSIL